MSKSIRVEPAQLRNAAAKMNEQVGEYEKLYNQLFTEVDGMGAAWQGIDNQAYVTQIKGFTEAFKKMSVLMKAYAQFLGDSAATYEKAQNEIIAGAKRL